MSDHAQILLGIVVLAVILLGVLFLVQRVHAAVAPNRVSKRVVDFENPTMKDIATFGAVLHTDVGISIRPRDDEDTVKISRELYDAFLQLVGAARTWRAEPAHIVGTGGGIGVQVLREALSAVDAAQSADAPPLGPADD